MSTIMAEEGVENESKRSEKAKRCSNYEKINKKQKKLRRNKTVFKECELNHRGGGLCCRRRQSQLIISNYFNMIASHGRGEEWNASIRMRQQALFMVLYHISRRPSSNSMALTSACSSFFCFPFELSFYDFFALFYNFLQSIFLWLWRWKRVDEMARLHFSVLTLSASFN